MLKLRNYEELCRRVEKGEVLSLKELSDRYLPQEDTWNKVAAWAVANGYKVQPEEMTHMTVFGETTVAKVQKTLGLHYARMVGTDGKEYTSTSEIPSLPAELADCVIGIAGLRSHIKPRPSQTAPITITANGNSYLLPQGLRQMYNANNLGLDGSGQTIVILESDVVNPSDLTAYWTQCGLPTTLAQFTEIDADPNNLPANDGIVEATMDIEAVSAMAPKAKILYVTGGFGASVVTMLINRLATDPTIHQISLSGGQEESFYINREPGESQYYAVLAAAGITFFASSGDSGSGGNEVAIGGYYDPTQSPSVWYPASDPFVTGVGGTTVKFTSQVVSNNLSALVGAEGAWTLPDPPITISGLAPNQSFTASGGGVSVFYPRPAWQKGPNIPTGSMRCVPDVAAMAAGSPPFFIYYHGAAFQGGGTSLASPIWAGLCALLNQARANASLPPLGLLGPHIYPLIGTAAFNQMTTGASASGPFTATANNGAYAVGPNFNLITGLGSPNVAVLATALSSGASAGVQPTITVQPSPQTVNTGAAASFSVAATGSSPLSYQWYFNSIRSLSAGDTSSNNDLGAVVTGATSSSYVVSSSDASNGGWYTVTVSNGAGTAVSSAAALTVNYAPVITVQPSSVTVTQGLPATFSVTVSAMPAPSYQWYLNGSPIGGATSAVYVITAAYPSNSGSYTVKGTNSAGATTSQTAILTVQPPAFTQAYLFSTIAGTATRFSAISGNADGVGAAALFESPRGIAVDSAGNVYVSDTGYNNYPRVAAEAVRKITPAGVVTTMAGTTGQIGSSDGSAETATFDAPMGLTVDATGNVYVADSGNNTIRKIAPGGVVSTIAGLAGQFGNVDGIGSAARFDMPVGVAMSTTGDIYVTDHQHEIIRKITPSGVVTTIAGGGDVGLDTDGTGTAARFNGPYGIAVDSGGDLYVSDQGGGTIRKITPSGVVTTLAGLAGHVGSSDGVGSAARFGYPEGIAVDGAGTVYVADPFNNTIRKITPAGAVTTIGGMAGQSGSTDGIGIAATFWSPQSIAVDSSGNLYIADSFTGVIRKGTLIAPPTITTQPASQTVTAGARVTFTVVATGTPIPTYQWTFNGANISGATSAIYSIASAVGSNAGSYDVVVSNAAGSVTSNAAPLTVNIAPSITTQPTSQSVTAGSGVAFTVTATGNPAPACQWYLNTKAISGATSASYVIASVSAANAGSYTVTATNTAGSANSSAASLTVNGPPTIATQPASQTVNAGSAATLSVAASGAMGYQWYFNGGLISGATNSTLTLANIGTTQAGSYGSYTVVATNQYGSVTSYPATVTVSVNSFLFNISTLGYVGSGAGQDLDAGFFIYGSGTKNILVVGEGPSLALPAYGGNASYSGLVLTAPELTFDGVYPAPTVAVGTNAAWGGGQTLINAFKAVYAPVFASNSSDTAIAKPVTVSGSNGYTVDVTINSGGPGLALVEVDDIDSFGALPTLAPNSYLANISARGYVGASGGSGIGTGVGQYEYLDAGFTVFGTTAQTVLIRAVGPSLANAPAPTLAKPKLTLYDSFHNIIATNSAWGTAPVPGNSTVVAGIQPATAAIMANVYATSLTLGSNDCAMVVTLPSGTSGQGAYTATVTSADNNSAGIALVEVYNVPPQ